MTERRIRLGVLPPTPRSNLYGFKSRWDRNVKASLTIQTESQTHPSGKTCWIQKLIYTVLLRQLNLCVTQESSFRYTIIDRLPNKAGTAVIIQNQVCCSNCTCLFNSMILIYKVISLYNVQCPSKDINRTEIISLKLWYLATTMTVQYS